MQSALEQEVRLLVQRARGWLHGRDRAVLFGALLCCVPFLPVTFVGLAITLGNLALVRLGKLPREELPLLAFAIVMTAFYVAVWWAVFAFVLHSGMWQGIGRLWSWVTEFRWLRLRGPFQDI